ncbi:hypothetical protein B6U99_06410 [Candidatus Geothermarchaeota archaeon ex4572_27]|nr:MAG: hypothetical protein B6U99_06410 [Candidatus Geothermarchaeota archaeon ex4572_27]
MRGPIDVVRRVMEVYEAIGEDYGLKRRRPWTQLLGHLDGLPRGSLVLDAGSGSGRHAEPLVERGVEVVCLDIASAPLKMARAKGLAAVRGDMAHLPFKDSCFDAELCIASLHHLPTRRLRVGALRELLRALREGGLAVVSVWSRRQLSMVGRLLRGLLAVVRGRLFEYGDVEVPWRLRGRPYLRYYHLYTGTELRRDMEEAGFKVLSVYGFSPRRSLLPRNYVAVGVRGG